MPYDQNLKNLLFTVFKNDKIVSIVERFHVSKTTFAICFYWTFFAKYDIIFTNNKTINGNAVFYYLRYLANTLLLISFIGKGEN